MQTSTKILTPGDVDGGIINVVNEIPAGSNHKIEWTAIGRFPTRPR